MTIPFQANDFGVVAVLPSGQVDFFDPAVIPMIEAVNAGQMEFRPELFTSNVIDPVVDLSGFHLAAPAIAFVEVTNLCNLRCKHCYVSSGYKRPDEMATDLILRTLDELAAAGVLQIFLTGGELFAHRDAVRIISHARSKPFITQIFTNGLLITEEKLAQLPPGTSFNISFDTADPERTIRGGMDFPKLRACFESMKKHGHIFRTALSVHRTNIHDALEIFEWCAENGYPRPQWLETHPLGRALLHPDILLQPEQVDEVFEVYKKCMDVFTPVPEDAPLPSTGREKSAAIKSMDLIKFAARLEMASGQEKCARSTAYVNAAGDVYPCSNCQSAQMFRGGNLKEQSFKEIWEEGFDAFRSITFEQYEVCHQCPVAQANVWCQFRCPPLAMNVSQDILGCGATEYLRLFMVKAHQYWEQRRRDGTRLSLVAPKRPSYVQ
jgi:radical SAM protein with 4Fe4S-binding SPASM domain